MSDATSYVCLDEWAEVVELQQLVVPAGRALDAERLRRAIDGIRSRTPMLPVVGMRLRDGRVQLLDGMHRYSASLQEGLAEIPCRFVSPETARDVYRFAE